MARRLTVSEALQSVFELDVSSDESELEEDPRFPLPVAFSDDETFSPPASPGPAGFVAYSMPPRSSVPVLVPAVENASASISPTTSPTLPVRSRPRPHLMETSPTQSAPPPMEISLGPASQSAPPPMEISPSSQSAPPPMEISRSSRGHPRRVTGT